MPPSMPGGLTTTFRIENQPIDPGSNVWASEFESTEGIGRYAVERLGQPSSGGPVGTYKLPKFARDPAQQPEASSSSSLIPTIATILRQRGINPAIRVPIEARVRTHRFTLGAARLLAFERNIDYKMSEDLAQAGGNEQLEKPVSFNASWNGEQEVYDLRTGKHLGRTSQIEVHLDPWQPSLYALLPTKVQGDVVEALLNNKPPRIIR